MRRLIVFMAVAAVALSAEAEHRITVDQLHDWLTAHKAANDSDNDMARQIALQSLTQRLTPPTLTRFEDEIQPGPKSELALQLLADCSAVLDPPPNELPGRPMPDAAAVQAMVMATVHFVGSTLRQMPDFLATRVTHSFTDLDPRSVLGKHDTTEDSMLIAPRAPLIPVGTYSQQITYRNGQEVPSNSTGSKQKPTEAPPGFTTRGEFGPVLTLILMDISRGKMGFTHWEQTDAGVAAVFHYQVPQRVSHYMVDYCCLDAGQDRASGATFHEGGLGQPATFTDSGQIAGTNQINDAFHGTPGYHGNIYINPDTGAILRITVDAELNLSEPITRSASSVEYGQVEIGGKTYICPVRSVAISVTRAYIGDQASVRTVLRINRAEFTNYHRFGSTIKVVASEATTQ